MAGINCTYDGENNFNGNIRELVSRGKAIPVCPEQLGGLPTPRIPCERKCDRVFTKNGEEVTENFIKGSKEALKLAKMINCDSAILKSHSPSCGVKQIYDGSFTNTLIKGKGVFAEMLVKENISIKTEKDILEGNSY